MPNWDFATVADHFALALAEAEAEFRLEQAVYGLDSLDERALQAMLAARLAPHFGVHREVHYPSTQGRKKTHRPRCDLVLCPAGVPLRFDTEPPGLFDPAIFCEPADALWLEVKIASQFREGGAIHGGYGAQWGQAVVEDLGKMEADPLIREAGLVLIVFNESEEILTKDLDLFEGILVQKGVVAGFRRVRSVAIQDRIGHRLCSAAVWPTIQR